MFGTELVLVNVTEGAAYGAALLAGVGTGVFTGVQEAVAPTVHVIERALPTPDHVARYAQLYLLYRSLYPALQATFQALAH